MSESFNGTTSKGGPLESQIDKNSLYNTGSNFNLQSVEGGFQQTLKQLNTLKIKTSKSLASNQELESYSTKNVKPVTMLRKKEKKQRQEEVADHNHILSRGIASVDHRREVPKIILNSSEISSQSQVHKLRQTMNVDNQSSLDFEEHQARKSVYGESVNSQKQNLTFSKMSQSRRQSNSKASDNMTSHFPNFHDFAENSFRTNDNEEL